MNAKKNRKLRNMFFIASIAYILVFVISFFSESNVTLALILDYTGLSLSIALFFIISFLLKEWLGLLVGMVLAGLIVLCSYLVMWGSIACKSGGGSWCGFGVQVNGIYLSALFLLCIIFAAIGKCIPKEKWDKIQEEER